MLVKNDYDSIFLSDIRDEVLGAVKYAYHQYTGGNLHVYGIPECLKKHSTSKADIQNSLEVLPHEMYRLKSENIYLAKTRKIPIVRKPGSKSMVRFDYLEP